jgi:hypothetical protein
MMKLRKIVFGLLIANFFLFACKSMEQQLKNNLGQLKDSLGVLKTKLGTLNSKMEALGWKFGLPIKRKITVGGKEYGTSEYWNFSALEKYVTTNKIEPFALSNRAFNVIERGKLGDEETAFNKLVGDSKYNDAVFQVAANDNVSWMWYVGGYQAGYFVNSTILGRDVTRSGDSNLLDKFFVGSPLPRHNGHLTLCTTGEDPYDINNVLINVHSGLEIIDTLVKDKGSKQIIHASITAGYSGGRDSAIKTYGDEKGIKIAQNCLKAGYEGTLLAAIKLGKRKVVLTFLGCHVFANAPKDVFDAIAKAVRTYVNGYNLNVTAYLDDTVQFTIEDDNNFFALRKEINGKDANIED